jgi:uncharacterized membrane-anchored protein YhcB (DUF1043 family)
VPQPATAPPAKQRDGWDKLQLVITVVLGFVAPYLSVKQYQLAPEQESTKRDLRVRLRQLQAQLAKQSGWKRTAELIDELVVASPVAQSRPPAASRR